MAKQVAFLRAVNVAGHGVVKMDVIKRAFAAAGCKEVQTVLASGNVIYEVAADKQVAVARKIQAALQKLTGPKALAIFRPLDQLKKLVKADPFADVDPARDVMLFVAFLAAVPRLKPQLPARDEKEGLELIACRKQDVAVVSGRKKDGHYGYPNLVVERAYGVTVTARNWNTVRKIAEKF